MEVRYSPILHTRKGLKLTQVMNAVLDGLTRAEREVDIKNRRDCLRNSQHLTDTSLRRPKLTVGTNTREWSASTSPDSKIIIRPRTTTTVLSDPQEQHQLHGARSRLCPDSIKQRCII